MKLTVLCDNTARIDAYYLAEPGVAYLLEEGEAKILFDTGYSDVYVRNAEKLGIALEDLTALVISHGHNDHTGGLVHLPPQGRKLPLYGHPLIFERKLYHGDEIGAPYTEAEAGEIFDLRLSAEPVQLTEHLWFLGEIPRTNDFENQSPVGQRMVEGQWVPDYLPDDSALVYRGQEGLTIITGCSHSGINNMTAYAQKLFGEERVVGIIGGFHMLQMNRQAEETVRWLDKLRPRHLRPCHCTCFHARAAIQSCVPTGETCVADVVEIQ